MSGSCSRRTTRGCAAIRVIRDYGLFDRREAPQYYPAIERARTDHPCSCMRNQPRASAGLAYGDRNHMMGNGHAAGQSILAAIVPRILLLAFGRMAKVGSRALRLGPSSATSC